MYGWNNAIFTRVLGHLSNFVELAGLYYHQIY